MGYILVLPWLTTQQSLQHMLTFLFLDPIGSNFWYLDPKPLVWTLGFGYLHNTS